MAIKSGNNLRRYLTKKFSMKTQVFFVTGWLLLCLSATHSQIINPKKVLEKKVNKTIDKKIDKTVDTLLDGQTKSNDNVKKDSVLVSKADTVIKPSADIQTSLQSYSQYDFVPGDSILLFEDFSQDAIGDFPALWTTNKSGEVNTLNIAPGNWLNLNATEGNWWFLKKINFPKNFIMEFDVVPKKGGTRYAVGVAIYGEDVFKEMSDPYNSKEALVINVSKSAWEAYGMKTGMQRIQGNSDLNLVKEEKVNHVIIWVQNRRVRIYHNGAKVLDMPTLLYEDRKFTRLGFVLYRGASCASYIGNIKVTTAAPDTRSKLLTEGKLVSYGIYFDVNKAIVKPESYGTLKDIAQVLLQNPDVRVKIVGHTDADGNDASNLDLSKRRALSVKNELVKTFGIDASRLEADGMGETKPVALNDTPSNKALNRRVEFIKL
jgi:OOP family OmpA-OmpF porin